MNTKQGGTKKPAKKPAKRVSEDKRHSGFDCPTIGVIVDEEKDPVKYLYDGSINPAWAKKHKK